MNSRLEIMYYPEAGIPSQDEGQDEGMANVLRGLREIWIAGNFDPIIDQLSALHIGNSDQLMILLDCVQPYINSHDIIGRNRLHLAVLENDVEAVQALLSLNINRDKSDWAGLTPLHYAHAISHTRIIELLEDMSREGISKPDSKGVYTIPQSHYDDHSEGTESLGADHCPPAPAELKRLCSQHPSLWAKYCQFSQTEMSRRAVKWPEEVCNNSMDVRSLVES
jgi:Ankyrin repeats (3 copies)